MTDHELQWQNGAPSSEALLDLDRSLAGPALRSLSHPWQILPQIGDLILELGQRLPREDFEQVEGNVWLSRRCRVAPTASLSGPLIVGHDTEIRHGAYIRGKVLVGDGAVVGNSTELKNCILFDQVQVPHYNYVGDSVLGHKAHMGAGAITSNVKGDHSLVVVRLGMQRIETGLKKFGAILGDFAEVGCNSVLNPGCILGRNCQIYPLSMVRGLVPPDSIYKQKNEIVLRQTPRTD